MHRADTHHAAVAFQLQPLGDGQGIIVAAPHENALPAQSASVMDYAAAVTPARKPRTMSI